MRKIYLDHSATTPLDGEVLEAMIPYLSGVHGNPSSIHAFGREAREALENARGSIAQGIGCMPEELVFTSGGTESDNAALRGVLGPLLGKGETHVLISAIEHHAVLETAHALEAQGAKVEQVPVDQSGLVSVADIKARIRETTTLISVMHANNEIGTIQPISEIADIAHAAGVPLHTDAVQSLGKIVFHATDLGVDLASFSAHKIYGPKGIGALFIRRGTRFEPLLRGGSQETNRRGGTESVALAVGFAKALGLSLKNLDAEGTRQRSLRDDLLKAIREKFPQVLVNGNLNRCLPNILSISFDSRLGRLDGDALIMGLDLRGIAVTSGSACTSGTLEPSHVLAALGRNTDTARATIRFSVGRSTVSEDIARTVQTLAEVVPLARC